MKKTVLFIAAIAAMLVLGSCIIIPYNEIAVEAEVLSSTTYNVGDRIDIDFRAENIGEFDLTGVRVLFEVDPDGPGGVASAKYWSSRFSLARGAEKFLSYTVDGDPDIGQLGTPTVIVIGVGLDNPPEDEYNY
jgi:hypothetical protein